MDAHYLSINQICQRTGLSRPFVAREMRRGHLKFGKVGRRVRVSHFWFHQWIEGRPVDAEPAPEEREAATSFPTSKFLTRLDEVASTLTGIASRMEERSKVLEGIGVNLSLLVEEVRARR